MNAPNRICLVHMWKNSELWLCKWFGLAIYTLFSLWMLNPIIAKFITSQLRESLCHNSILILSLIKIELGGTSLLPSVTPSFLLLAFKSCDPLAINIWSLRCHKLGDRSLTPAVCGFFWPVWLRKPLLRLHEELFFLFILKIFLAGNGLPTMSETSRQIFDGRHMWLFLTSVAPQTFT